MPNRRATSAIRSRTVAGLPPITGPGVDQLAKPAVRIFGVEADVAGIPQISSQAPDVDAARAGQLLRRDAPEAFVEEVLDVRP